MPSGKFVISHLGILGYDRNPVTFFKVISELIEENAEFKEKINLSFPGQVDYSVMEIIKSYKLESYVTIPGNLDRKTALQVMKDTNLLLLLLNKQINAKGRIPGKLFEYLAVKRSILCIGDTHGDSAAIITNSKAGFISEYDDHSNLKSILLKEFDNYQNDLNGEDIKSEIESYSIKKLTFKIANLLTEIS